MQREPLAFVVLSLLRESSHAMKHEGFIRNMKVASDQGYIVFSDAKGVVAECPDLERAKAALRNRTAESKEWGMEPNLAIFKWANDRWKPAVSLYQLQELNPAEAGT